MDDGGRRAQAIRAAARRRENNDGNTREQPRHAVSFAQIITDALRQSLEVLGATEPSFMIGKTLAMSDVNHEQARLLLSCKHESPSQVTSVFTETETRFVEDSTGLLVTAFDRAGRSYDLTCKYLVSNTGYRFVTGWKKYVQQNGLGVAMRVELWWFRSLKLHNRYEDREGKGGKQERLPVTVESGHPDGSLGLVLLHYENGLLEPEQAAAGEAPSVLMQETENDLEQEQAAADEPGEPPVQEMETGHVLESKTATTAGDKLADDGGTCAEPIKSKTSIVEEDKLADGGGECAELMIRNINTTVIPTPEVFNAAIGLLDLRKHYGGGGHGGRGGGRRRLEKEEEDREVEKQELPHPHELQNYL